MLERYGHGGDMLTAERLYGLPRGAFADFSSNMNPWGPPAGAREAMMAAWEEIAAYPDPAARKLRTALSARHGVPVESIWVGNGAAELIDLVMRSMRPETVTLLAPGFAEYETAVRRAGGVPEFVPLTAERDFLPEPASLIGSAKRTGAVLIGNPNNPTGRLLRNDVIDELIHTARRIVFDEAFLDFAPDERQRTVIRHASSHSNVFVIRSLTKFYSIPGLRLGYVVAHPEAIGRIRELAVPWSVNAIAMAVGAAALQDEPFAAHTLAWLPPERAWLSGSLSRLGLKVFPSDANFLLFQFPPDGAWRVKQAQSALGAAGVLIRDASLFRGLDDTYCRVAVKRREDNERLVEALRNWMEAGGGQDGRGA
ncbi:threonine-phosphate decarboxylase CobD [Paenibacillus alkalitolerans]|uniref:threonine-phosphate decarboxylase CobD n=1 Tax=Paenibacillus alkalitolerans TaxID=2799335 RepID=UPI0018F3C44E|nr:threonine-phosphate decarboxylase CobD [Paenibacillus alkalitolerans]